MFKLKKGDKVVYLGTFPYKLANGQEVSEEGEELLIRSDVNVQKRFFRLIDELEKVEKVVESESVELQEKEELKIEESKIEKKSKNKNVK